MGDDLATARSGYVICVGISLETSAAIAHAARDEAVVLVAPDLHSARVLIDGNGRGPVGAMPHTVYEYGQLRLDTVRHQVTWAGEPVHLSAREFELLTALVADPGRVLTFAELSERYWSAPYRGDPEAVVSAVKRLRNRLADQARGLVIESVRGIGFRAVLTQTSYG